MFLIPVEIVKPHVHPFFSKNDSYWNLLGYMPSNSDPEASSHYYSVETEYGRVVPVYFLAKGYGDASQPLLFFRGCDDGHTGIPVASLDEALEWIKNCPYAEFDSLFRASCDGVLKPGLEYFN